MAGKLQRTTLFEAAVAAIKQNILNGEWPPGSRLPTERELIEQFGISRSPLREALKALQAMGLLDIRHGEGIFVNDLPERVQSRKEVLTLFDGVTAFHVLDIRRILELEAVGRAARRASEVDLQHLETAYQAMVERQGDVERFREADLNFHLLLADMAGNPLLARVVRELRSVLLQQMQRDMMG